jgi:hypothetical protein
VNFSHLQYSSSFVYSPYILLNSKLITNTENKMDHLVTGRIRKEAWKKKAYACMGGGSLK